MTTFTGQCLCGNVTYKADGEIVMQGNCHCSDCRQSSGSPFATLLFLKQDDIEIKGDLKKFDHTVDSGNVLTKSFCPNCGSQMFAGNAAKPNMLAVKAGSVNEHEIIAPQFNVYAGSKMNCTTLNSDVPAFDKMPPG